MQALGNSLIRASVGLIIVSVVIGCGSKPAPPPPKVIPPTPVANPGPGPAVKPKADTASKPAKPDKNVKPEKKLVLPPGTDPNSVFAVVATNTLMDVGLPSTPPDQLIVESAPLVNSTQVTVVTASPDSKGQPKGFTLPTGFVAMPEAGYADDGMPLRIRCQKTGSTLALVPAGVAKIGTNSGPAECQPEFSVHVDTFYMEVFETTVEQFETYRTDMKEKKKPIPTVLNPGASPRTPVLGVPWGTAQVYARWAGMDLPTEVEFEKAARGPNSFRTPWGNSRAVWPNNRTTSTITTGGAYASDMSPYGIYDLAGNVREWCNDLYSDHAHQEAGGTSGQAPHNWAGPKKASTANHRLVKGNGADWSAWHRQGREVGKGYPDVGFRCVLRIPTTEPKAGT